MPAEPTPRSWFEAAVCHDVRAHGEPKRLPKHFPHRESGRATQCCWHEVQRAGSRVINRRRHCRDLRPEAKSFEACSPVGHGWDPNGPDHGIAEGVGLAKYPSLVRNRSASRSVGRYHLPPLTSGLKKPWPAPSYPTSRHSFPKPAAALQ
jgi:hypothetical protein